MSLDIYLTRKKWVSYDEGKTYTEENEEVYSVNITHNLGEMARESGIYEVLWNPYKFFKTKASDIIPYLESGIEKLKNNKSYFEKFNSPNGWGVYNDFVPSVENYLEACKKYPNSIIEISK